KKKRISRQRFIVGFNYSAAAKNTRSWLRQPVSFGSARFEPAISGAVKVADVVDVKRCVLSNYLYRGVVQHFNVVQTGSGTSRDRAEEHSCCAELDCVICHSHVVMFKTG